MSKYIQVKHNF